MELRKPTKAGYLDSSQAPKVALTRSLYPLG